MRCCNSCITTVWKNSIDSVAISGKCTTAMTLIGTLSCCCHGNLIFPYQPGAARSKTVILVKNLPATTKVQEIIDLFAKYGTIGRVILPPSGVTAIVEFVAPTEARTAFRSLAYTKVRWHFSTVFHGGSPVSYVTHLFSNLLPLWFIRLLKCGARVYSSYPLERPHSEVYLNCGLADRVGLSPGLCCYSSL